MTRINIFNLLKTKSDDDLGCGRHFSNQVCPSSLSRLCWTEIYFVAFVDQVQEPVRIFG